MKRTWTIIGVADVARSLKWYQSLFGPRRTAPAHDDFAQVLDADGTVLLCLIRSQRVISIAAAYTPSTAFPIRR